MLDQLILFLAVFSCVSFFEYLAYWGWNDMTGGDNTNMTQDKMMSVESLVNQKDVQELKTNQSIIAWLAALTLLLTMVIFWKISCQ